MLKEEKLTKAKSSADGNAAVERLMEAEKEIATISDYLNACKKQFGNLSWRVNFLEMMFRDLKKSRELIPDEAVQGLVQLWDALDAARKLFMFGSYGSKNCLVLERDKKSKWFEEITAQIKQVRDSILLDKLDNDDEMRESVEFLDTQFKRVKERVVIPDTELSTISYIIQESLALLEIVAANGDPEQRMEIMLMLFKKIENYLETKNHKMEIQSNLRVLFSYGSNGFRCPISLKFMRDPVVVATGEAYERDCIQKWFDAGHDTCPKTGEKLSNKTLIPHITLARLIAKYCEPNGLDRPQHPSKPSKPSLLLQK